MKILLIIITSINFCLSFYYWSNYAHNVDISYSQIKGYEELYKEKGDLPRTEILKILLEAKINQRNNIISKTEWLIKLLLDGIIIILVMTVWRKYEGRGQG